jgi:hypothetical protein
MMNLQCKKIMSSLSNQSIIGTCSATYLHLYLGSERLLPQFTPNMIHFKLGPEHPRQWPADQTATLLGHGLVLELCDRRIAEMLFTEASFQPSRSVALKVRRNKIALRELRDVKMLRRQASGIQIFGIFSVIKSNIYAVCFARIELIEVHDENIRFRKYGGQYIQRIYAFKIFCMFLSKHYEHK